MIEEDDWQRIRRPLLAFAGIATVFWAAVCVAGQSMSLLSRPRWAQFMIAAGFIA